MTMTDPIAILFADICGSTSLYETVGDGTAHQLVDRCLTRLGGIVRSRGGTVIKTIGDSVLAVFPDVGETFRAAEDMHASHQDGLALRIGFHHGPVIRTATDVFGDAVNLAARVVALARPEEALMTRDAFVCLPDPLRERTALLDTTQVKGRRDIVDIYRIVPPHEEEATITAMAVQAIEDAAPSLQLTAAGGGVTLLGSGERCVIGRDASCDLAVPGAFASRRHCVVINIRGRFMLTDQSTNGTYVTLPDGTVQFLKREAAQLVGQGIISLGVRLETDHDAGTIHFRCSHG